MPGGSIRGHTATGHQHMDVGMMVELAGPSVQHRQDAHLCPDKAFLGGQITHALGGRLHQQTVERLLMA